MALRRPVSANSSGAVDARVAQHRTRRRRLSCRTGSVGGRTRGQLPRTTCEHGRISPDGLLLIRFGNRTVPCVLM